MHIILGFLGTVVTILWLLYRLAEMGIDLGGLNPFLWHRRRKWKKQHDANPIFKISNPLEATALLVTAAAKADGDMSSEERRGILSVFENEFHLSKKEAVALLASSSHLLGRGEEVKNKLKLVLAPSLKNFKPDQAESAIELLHRISNLDGSPSEFQRALISDTTAILSQASKPKGKWDEAG